ncbi:MAG TPA: hypothetical protein DCS07_17975 [Bdellovibrionales bacterium]|nr:MAG: hypothetical protein A2Z97_10225 [Bdellovibrionales bacterium GWB1_52_6]OFZ05293.1 MAG: hypothetical protein A2X97_10935 [Bdellovibrionales bacterium GWA1_52_35]OFZ43507.1 MAG: hypothetical protein A2070_14215 [Bdellovibrionales bacterium GWC1_52_8]HAR44490.1 hypothetical protein [Bdellovibrionales bacterium]HCM38567.1 hypothetical protein [Bdellovibrionales bacterium]
MKTLLLVFGLMIVNAGLAYAGSPKQWVFKCHFTAQNQRESCEIVANVCRYNHFTPLEDLATLPSPPPPRGCIDWLSVRCSGKEITKGRATHATTAVSLPHTTMNFEVLIANSNASHAQAVTLRYVSQAPGTANPFYISSWLGSGEDELRGHCRVYQPPFQ